MKKLMVLGGLGLGLAMMGRKRGWRRYGGYGHGVPGGPAQAVNLPPFMEATLKAWHDRAHGTAPPAEPTGQPGGAQV
jgi:hypothetical protein